MSVALGLLLVASLGAVPEAVALKEPAPSLTLLFTGDNGGEIAPCG